MNPYMLEDEEMSEEISGVSAGLTSSERSQSDQDVTYLFRVGLGCFLMPVTGHGCSAVT